MMVDLIWLLRPVTFHAPLGLVAGRDLIVLPPSTWEAFSGFRALTNERRDKGSSESYVIMRHQSKDS